MTGPSTNPYTSKAASGYNASPPADDGSKVTANLISWANLRAKLTDVLKTFTEAVNAEVLSAFGKSVNCDDTVQNVIGGSIALESDELTIASGSITVDKSHHTVDTESDAASDDLANILTTSVADETILIIRAAHTDRTVVVKDAATGAGQIHLHNSEDYSLDDDQKSIILQRRGADWYELSRSVDENEGGSTKLISSVDLSNNATVEFTGFDSSLYDNYMFLLQNVIPTEVTANLLMRTSSDGGSSYDSGAADYYGASTQIGSNGGGGGVIGSAGATGMQVFQEVGGDATEDGASGIVWLYGPHLAFETVMTTFMAGETADGNYSSWRGGYVRVSSADVDAVQFLFHSGSLESGTINMYGLKNA